MTPSAATVTLWKTRILKLFALLARYPRLIALYGFVSGVGSFFLVDRGARLAVLVAAIMLVSWLWLLLEGVVRRLVARLCGWELPPPLLRFATQLIHQETLFFVLPFFLVTTSWNSGQALFTGLLAVAALVSVIDPLYHQRLASRRWLYLGFHTLTLFAALLTALPIILHLSTAQSYPLALGIAVLLSFASLYSVIPVARWRGAALIGLTLVLGLGGWLARVWVPPATLWLTDVAITTQLDGSNRAPADSLGDVNIAQLRAGGLYAYTAISAPRGLNERIYHEWLHNGERIDRIALDIHGGRKEGYRAWTRKQNFPEDAEGRWQVKVLTEAGQMIGTLRFHVSGPHEAAANEAPDTPASTSSLVQPKNQ
ncbi:DUF5924 family protein [Pseudomonas mangiferae]|uniref:DUF2914 domain-containing protein n=1 Tax=Pseudomonas mangiferae TaxID=2593654 RepID=A0A553GYI2_9PSED|nr:DUF5924 family protein [Pseudomonas mangiferae]TRX74534.1 DUF2914 domain-containing protein [Pseudomonas mangiferae]